MQLFLTALISGIVSLGGMFLAYNYAPLDIISINVPNNLGSTITTILGTDTLSASRAVINTNFSNLNTDKLQSGDTAALLTIGTLTLTNPLTVANGGTGSTTLSSNQVLLGNGTGNVKVVTGHGTLGQFLTSGGAGAAPTWSTAAIDQAGNYTWTGDHIFTRSTTTNATTTGAHAFGSAISLNGVKLNFGTAGPSASSTILSFSSAGFGSFNHPPKLVADGTSYGSTANASTTVYTYKIPAGMLSISDGIRITANMLSTSNGEKTWDVGFGNGTATSSLISRGIDAGVNNTIHTLEAEFFNAGSASTQWGMARFYTSGSTLFASSTATTVNTANASYIQFVTRNTANDSDNVQFVGITIEKLTQ